MYWKEGREKEWRRRVEEGRRMFGGRKERVEGRREMLGGRIGKWKGRERSV